MPQHRAVQPRQIYASTVSRRERRWMRARARSPLGMAFVTIATLVAAVAAIAAITPGLS